MGRRLALVFLVALAPFGPAHAAPGVTGEKGNAGLRLHGALPEGRFVARVYYAQTEDIRALTSYDLFEFNDLRERYVLVQIDAEEWREIQTLGLRLEVDEARTAAMRRPVVLSTEAVGIPGYPCYRTVEESFVDAQQLMVDHPTLVSYVDAGDSWEKTAGLGGYDLNFLVLTNSAVPGPKPSLVVTSSIHAREYTPAELSLRFAEHLAGSYGSDADATWLLDHHEIHLLIHGNPDGRKQAEAGLSWRKNTDQNYCSPTSDSRGADLNRNFDFQWGCCDGSSGSECDSLYRGPAPASEPETQAIQAHLRSVFPDQRESALDEAAPDDATGVYLDVHSYGELVLWPWGIVPGPAPNAAGLQTLGRKLAFPNGHDPRQGYQSYAVDGAAKEFGYGELGVASYTIELGTNFFEDCGVFEGTILPDNLPMLIYAAKAARTPYRTPSGPDVVDARAVPALVDAGVAVTVEAVVDDTRFNHGNGSEPTQAIAAVELYIDVPPWEAGAAPVALSAADGTFDSTVEMATGALDTSALAGGRHLLFLRGQDAGGNWGAFTGAFLFITDGTEGTVGGVVTDADTAAPLAANVSVDALGLATASNPLAGAYALTLPAGSWEMQVTAPDHLAESVSLDMPQSGSLQQDFALAPVPSILLVDDDDNGPDVRAYYTDALDALGEDYFLWDTANSDNEPDLAMLEAFDTVIWFTGDEFGGTAGPGAAGEDALTEWLDLGRCLMISSQEYYWDRGLTSFMQNYLGVASAGSDVSHATVQGQGAAFGALGPYTLSFPYSNYTDSVSPGVGGELAFSGSPGDAGVMRDTSFYRTTYWGFGFETLPAPADRKAALLAFLDWCAPLPDLDADADGTANGADCAPQDADAWSEPSPPLGLMVSGAPADNLTWSAPAVPGAASVTYDVLRGETPDSLAASCLVTGTAGTATTDGAAPAAGAIRYYVIRARNACGENLGTTSSGSRRIGPVCF